MKKKTKLLRRTMLRIFISWSAARWLFSIVIGRNCSRESLQTAVQPPLSVQLLIWPNRLKFRWTISRKTTRLFLFQEWSFLNYLNHFVIHHWTILCFVCVIRHDFIGGNRRPYNTLRTGLACVISKCKNHSVIVRSDKIDENLLSRWNAEIPSNT